jgi:2-dehydro-3-deoxyphosphogluconate aldolase / (4S)-4-hydroxy-2-oxoglutarate aldolase
VFRELMAARAEALPDMLMGIGTVFTPADATRFIEAGAAFVVSPICNPAVGRVCAEANVPWLPGCMTLTETYLAHEAGAAIVKVFPGEVVGPAFVKSVRSVLPAVKLMVTGGVEPTAESLGRWFGAGAVSVGMGSQLFPKVAIQAGDWAAIEQTIRQTLHLAEQTH